MLGVLTASAATGQLLFLPFLAQLVHHHGWRQAALAIACAAVAVLPLVLLFMRNNPEDKGLLPYGADPKEIDTEPSSTGHVHQNPFHVAILGLQRGMVSRDFWLLALMGILDLFGTTLSGWLSDRCNSRYLLCWYYGLRGLTYLS